MISKVENHPPSREAGALVRGLAPLLPSGELVTEGPQLRESCQDGTGNRGISGSADALVLPGTTAEVAATFRWCYEHDVPMTPRGGGTGLAAGAVPDGGIVLSIERLNTLRSVDPELWRMEAEAGVRTARIQRVARENGLLFPPDPGAGEQSTLGGNIATNAGGPHAFKYGVTGSWVTGVEVVIPPGEVVTLGGPIRKDVAGFDLLDLIIGSEGTLGIVTAAWLRLVPAPEARSVTVGFYENSATGCEAVATVMASGIQATALEFLDAGAVTASIGSFPFEVPANAGFAVLAEADGHPDEVVRVADQLGEAMQGGAVGEVLRITDRGSASALWSWRDGVSIAVTTQKGGKISEDIVVPGDRLLDAIQGTVEIGRRHGLEACSWGHAGDGNIHATFLVDLEDPDQMVAGDAAAMDVFQMAIDLGGSISGEHGIGSLKTDCVSSALDPAAVRLQAAIKRTFDPKLLLNPGKKIPL